LCFDGAVVVVDVIGCAGDATVLVAVSGDVAGSSEGARRDALEAGSASRWFVDGAVVIIDPGDAVVLVVVSGDVADGTEGTRSLRDALEAGSASR
jgi:hypothetical protein